MKKYLVSFLMIVFVGLSSGCATGRYSIPDPTTNYETRPDKALVVMFRPSNFGAAISAALFDATGEQNQLFAVLGPKEKVAYYCAPGDRLFMVIAENADFMEAKLEAGKIYYAIVTPRVGMWKARFSLHPFKVNHPEREFILSSSEHRQWLADCHFILPNAGAVNYGQANAVDIQVRRTEYAGKWTRMLEQDKQWRRLLPEDGVVTPIR